MDEQEQFKLFIRSLLDIHRDNFIELLKNPEFQSNAIEKKETAVLYVTELFKAEIEDTIDAFMKDHLHTS